MLSGVNDFLKALRLSSDVLDSDFDGRRCVVHVK